MHLHLAHGIDGLRLELDDDARRFLRANILEAVQELGEDESTPGRASPSVRPAGSPTCSARSSRAPAARREQRLTRRGHVGVTAVQRSGISCRRPFAPFVPRKAPST